MVKRWRNVLHQKKLFKVFIRRIFINFIFHFSKFLYWTFQIVNLAGNIINKHRMGISNIRQNQVKFILLFRLDHLKSIWNYFQLQQDNLVVLCYFQNINGPLVLDLPQICTTSICATHPVANLFIKISSLRVDFKASRLLYSTWFGCPCQKSHDNLRNVVLWYSKLL